MLSCGAMKLAGQVDIINGDFDVNEDGVVDEATDDLFNCDLDNENNGIPIRDQVDIRRWSVDVDEDTSSTSADVALRNVQLFVLP